MSDTPGTPAFTSIHERGAVQGTARVLPVRRGFVCVECGHASMDPGLCPSCQIPLEEIAHSYPEDDLPYPDDE